MIEEQAITFLTPIRDARIMRIKVINILIAVTFFQKLLDLTSKFVKEHTQYIEGSSLSENNYP